METAQLQPGYVRNTWVLVWSVTCKDQVYQGEEDIYLSGKMNRQFSSIFKKRLYIFQFDIWEEHEFQGTSLR